MEKENFCNFVQFELLGIMLSESFGIFVNFPLFSTLEGELRKPGFKEFYQLNNQKVTIFTKYWLTT